MTSATITVREHPTKPTARVYVWHMAFGDVEIEVEGEQLSVNGEAVTVLGAEKKNGPCEGATSHGPSH